MFSTLHLTIVIIIGYFAQLFYIIINYTVSIDSYVVTVCQGCIHEGPRAPF